MLCYVYPQVMFLNPKSFALLQLYIALSLTCFGSYKQLCRLLKFFLLYNKITILNGY